ncbi:iron uptake porin [Thermosynechococcaceae cyanobacterium BACA0444]|uniref:Iron uptake porin n=1 Tax=Pseudocalidococcus azoricus BACA0444 TaxID=2918990 RepID=A0AAE4FTR3_9CYAN|nr:iron uptake porin [Pseudocalidococcus azoricus]MDS3862100.1 iron uptake porin [Pseudocalidococcus azoricus BACA0444]
MKKNYLLAGSLSLLGVIAGLSPAQAAADSLSNSGSAEVSTAKFDALLAAQPSDMAPAPVSLPAATPVIADNTNVTSVSQLMSVEDSMGQVTSVSQLSDVRPTDWAYQALASLVEKYGCIAGYPDGTFRGNRAATRYEMAAALNACLDVISDRFATKEDLAALRKLMDEFAAELATLRGRVDNLEARTAALEATQFSTTTKLSGLVTISGQYGSATSGPVVNAVTPNGPIGSLNPTVIAGVLLSLNTSFTGSDLLETTLSTGNGGLDTISQYNIGANSNLASGGPLNTQSYFNPGQYYWAGFGPGVALYRLAYTFKPVEDVSVTAAAQFYPSDIIDTNSWANSPAKDFGSYFFINNPFIVPYAMNFLGGAGAAIQWNPGEGGFTVRALYAAANAGLANPNAAAFNTSGGFGGDPYQASVEFEYAGNINSDGSNNYVVKAQYTNSRTFGVPANAGGINFEVNLGQFGIFGRGGIAGISDAAVTPLPGSQIGGVIIDPASGSLTVGTFMAGIGYKDLFIPGSTLAVAAGSPFINGGGSQQVNVEGFYRFPVSDNISITPIISAIINPNTSGGAGFNSNPAIVQGVVRTTFSF